MSGEGALSNDEKLALKNIITDLLDHLYYHDSYEVLAVTFAEMSIPLTDEEHENHVKIFLSMLEGAREFYRSNGFM